MYGVALAVLFLATALPSFPGKVADRSKLRDLAPWPDELSHVDQAPGGDANRLVVLLHGLGNQPDSLDDVVALVRRVHPAADVMTPQLPLSLRSFGDLFADLEVVAERLIRRIDERNQEHAYQHITLAGHSIGAILARKLWVLAHGAAFDGEVDLDRFAGWPEKIDRVVLLAGMNRGWSIGSAIRGNSRYLSFLLGAGLGHLVSALTLGWAEPAAFQVRRGAPFLTRMRLQWLEVERKLRQRDRRGELPVVVQLLGTEDDLVAPTDHIDLASGNHRNFHYVEVKGTDHAQILMAGEQAVDGLDPETCASTGESSDLADRASKICLAMRGNPDQIGPVETELGDVRALARETLLDTGVSGALEAAGEPPPTDVVLVIHGIRDEGYWARRLAQRVRNQHDPNRRFETKTDSYGYFPMLPFIVPWTRRSKVEWLLDRFVAIKSQFPDATLHYVGHSNGTFLLAKALEVLPMRQLRFGRVVTAGSVLPQDHEWPVGGRQARVGCVANYVATADWVVALFPNGISLWGHVGELGGAGHDGFGGDPGQPGISHESDVLDLRWVEGGHSAALREGRWSEIASFVTGSGADCTAGAGLSVDRGATRSSLAVIGGHLSPLIVALLLLIVTAIGWACLKPMCRRDRGLAVGLVAWTGVILALAFVF